MADTMEKNDIKTELNAKIMQLQYELMHDLETHAAIEKGLHPLCAKIRRHVGAPKLRVDLPELSAEEQATAYSAVMALDIATMRVKKMQEIQKQIEEIEKGE